MTTSLTFTREGQAEPAGKKRRRRRFKEGRQWHRGRKGRKGQGKISAQAHGGGVQRREMELTNRPATAFRREPH